ncbi:unnamed protein product [marine sediment metagenome]|uniref:Uncharacterized protein n=1 Tax=marine sediment metagenome TaxID=412755 RepID=X0YFR3_9ZZZZ
MDIIDRRFKFLTTKQREIAEIAKEKGFVTYGEIKMFYSSKEHWSRAIKKLVAFSILIPDKNSSDGNVLISRFNYNPSPEAENTQKTLKKLGID